MKKQIHGFVASLLYIFLNYFVAYIPAWWIRRLIYKCLGLKIGTGSRIMMRAVMLAPWRIRIGERSYVNERCFIDGRGGLTIGNNVNIASDVMIITGTHDRRSPSFDYKSDPIKIENSVWIATRAILLNGSIARKRCLIAAGAIISPHQVCQDNGVYVGNPAVLVKNRELSADEINNQWHVYFR